ncbi:uncharacterized protein LOC142240640 [Haematobia irritans]|uniref:uncharacterized protein LOC142240640 n=1 Tax=Haematobia irritans TaxID=7368 RepID=UPI003F50657C
MKTLCGLPLNTAAIVVGSFSAVIFFYASIHTTYNLVEFMRRPKIMGPEWIVDPDTGEISHGSIGGRKVTKGPKTTYTGWIMDIDRGGFHWFFVGLCVTSFVSSILLVVGAIRNNRKLLVPWLVTGTVTLVGLSLCLIYTIYLFIIYSLNGWCVEGNMVIVLFVSIISLALQLYFWLGIQKLFMNLTDYRERLKILPTTVPLYAQDEGFY